MRRDIRMKSTATHLIGSILMLGLVLAMTSVAQAQTYIGEAACISCHNNFDGDLVSEYQKSGHRYKLNAIDAGDPKAPTYPDGRLYHPLGGPPVAPALVTPPAGTNWSDFAYVIGGYGWKARFIRTNGRIYTDDDQAQQNLFNNSRTTYHEGEDKKYNFGCFQCHTTGPDPAGSWNGVPADELGTFSEPGVRCEGCHGPGSDHQAGAFNNPPVLPPIQGDQLVVERCIDCHQRGGSTNLIPVKGGYIRHHEQGNEFRASKHGDGKDGELTCISCHEPHVALHYPDVAGEGFDGLNATCETCHQNKTIMLNNAPKEIECVDCHMPKASKSALGMQVGNGWKGDVSTHIMAINTDPVTKTEMWDSEENHVQLDQDGIAKVTMDFACLQCHSNKTVGWAANYAPVMHALGIVTSTDDLADVPREFELLQNFPNPFNPTTTIRFDLPETADVRIELYSVDGRFVGSILNQKMPAGKHQVEVNASSLASGNYVYRLNAGSFSASRTMILLK